MIVKIRNLVWFCCAWWFCLCARADFEIESFTRYRVDNFDNNNNGYANITDDGEEFGFIESIAVAKGIDTAGSLGPFLEVWAPPTSSSSGSSDLPNSVSRDFDDIYSSNSFPTRREGYSYIQSRSLLLERVLRFSPKQSDEPTDDEVTHVWEVSYGARFNQLDDFYGYSQSGGVLGRLAINNFVDNQQAGPHIGVAWNMSQGPWTVSLNGIAQAGLGTTDAAQTSLVGEDLIPGQYNRPIYLQPMVVNDEDYDEFASYYGEIRAQISRTLTEQFSLNVGCSGYYFGNVQYADDSINWYLPSFGITDNGMEDTFISTAFANLEFRR